MDSIAAEPHCQKFRICMGEWKLYYRVPSRAPPFTFSDTSAIGCIV